MDGTNSFGVHIVKPFLSQVAVSATTAVYDGLEILCALAPKTGLRLSDK